ncbi:hypothetical protein [Virgibacillus ainsalahensis]
MVITTSLSELTAANEEINQLQKAKPTLYEKLSELIQLTRQLQFKYQYMGCLLMDEDSDKFSPEVHVEYIIRLYRQEVEKLKADSTFDDLKGLLSNYRQVGYCNLCQLINGDTPENLVGPRVVY